MRAAWTTWLAISLWTLAMTLGVCMCVLMYASEEFNDLVLNEIGLILTFLVLGSLATIGALLATHRPTNPISWLFLAAAIAMGIHETAFSYVRYITEVSPGGLPEITLLFWFGGWAYVPMFLLLPTFGLLLFPTGRLPSRRWRPFAWVVAIWLSLVIVAEMFRPGPLEPVKPLSSFNNPLGIQSLDAVFNVMLHGLVLTPIFFVAVAGSVISIFTRMRQASDSERRQIKWIAYAAIVLLVGIGITLILAVSPGFRSKTADDFGYFIVILGVAVLIPVAIGIAILRHNLYDIDRLINRTLVYGSLTITLLLSFAGSVIFFQFLLSPLTSGNDLAVAGSTLLVAALFRPVRNRLQRFIDRRFYRRKYDARQTLQTFSVTARDAVQLDELTGDLTAVVARTVQPAHISIWLNRLDLQEERQ